MACFLEFYGIFVREFLPMRSFYRLGGGGVSEGRGAGGLEIRTGKFFVGKFQKMHDFHGRGLRGLLSDIRYQKSAFGQENYSSLHFRLSDI
jgi:hypothetical protein